MKSSLCVFSVAVLFSVADARAMFVYDFPGNPGSGAAAAQANPQPANATFSDFTRHGPGASNTTTDVFESNTFSTSATINTSSYLDFSVTANPSHHLDLSQLTFDVDRSAGTGSGEVDLFLNGSATAYSTFAFTPTTTLTTNTFDLGPLTDAQNVTSADFRIYIWNVTGNGERVWFDNVTTNGSISNVPEASQIWAALLPLSLAGLQMLRVLRLQRTA